MNNPFDYTPDAECEEAFRMLTERIEALKKSDLAEDVMFCRELEAGKMLGVLIAADEAGRHQTLYAFSGQAGTSGFHFPGFVPPVSDYLQPSGHFKTKEADITRQNKEIARYEEFTLREARNALEERRRELSTAIEDYREKCKVAKQCRDARRRSGMSDDAQRDEMLRESQFEKAELRRKKKHAADILRPLEAKVEESEALLAEMKERRRKDSEELQDWLFANFKVLNARGESLNLKDIFKSTNMKTPPSGAGECCGPKLLQAAYLAGLTPLSIAEYWYGHPKEGEVRIHGVHYPACRGKCLPVLGWMLQGLEITPPLGKESYSIKASQPKILFENRWFCILDKPSGMLSVPGKGETSSLQCWLEATFGADRKVRMAHRLDQDTSGLIMATFGDEAYKAMQALFATRRVAKTYAAVLSGDYRQKGLPEKGNVNLPLSPDWLDRPRQRVDRDFGKEAVTDYEFTDVSDGRSRVLFHPHTGRTHQLRVHAASAGGLGMPIVGDRLYGADRISANGRLLLHACKMEFTSPFDGRRYSFTSPVPF